MKLFLMIGALLGFLVVALGAFGAHGLEGKVSKRGLENWGKAVDYQMFHTIAIIAVAILIGVVGSSPLLSMSGWFFLIGIIVFSGSLYLYAVTETKTFAMVTPLGGLSFLIGWILLAISVIKL